MKTLCLAAFAAFFWLTPAHAQSPDAWGRDTVSVPSAIHADYSARGGRPRGCPAAWCGCGLSLKMFGRIIPRLNLARNWAKEGSAAVKGCVNCVAVLTRGRGARSGHVGIVQGYDSNGNPIIFSGNHNRRWGTGIYAARRVIAYRQI